MSKTIFESQCIDSESHLLMYNAKSISVHSSFEFPTILKLQLIWSSVRRENNVS